MATFVLIHGGGGGTWDWHLLEPELRALGHDVVAPALPTGDPHAGPAEYAEFLAAEIGDRRELVVVGHSFGGITAALLPGLVPVERLILLAGMIPLPGEAPEDWWAATGFSELGVDYSDPIAAFLHDLPRELAEEAMRQGRDEADDGALARPLPLREWPPVPTHLLLCRDDRFFPLEFMRRVAAERLPSVTPDEIDGSHGVALSRPKELAARLDAYLGQ